MFGDRLAIRAIKIYADGALGSRGAWLLDPYADRPGHYRPSGHRSHGAPARGARLPRNTAGSSASTPSATARTASSSTSIQEALDRTPTADHRFRIEHAQLVDPSDIPRFRLNGVIPSIQPCHATSDAAMAVERLGLERVYRIGYPYKSFLEAWLHPAIGTDAPVEPISPVGNYYAAIMRQDARRPAARARSCPSSDEPPSRPFRA